MVLHFNTLSSVAPLADVLFLFAVCCDWSVCSRWPIRRTLMACQWWAASVMSAEISWVTRRAPCASWALTVTSTSVTETTTTALTGSLQNLLALVCVWDRSSTKEKCLVQNNVCFLYTLVLRYRWRLGILLSFIFRYFAGGKFHLRTRHKELQTRNSLSMLCKPSSQWASYCDSRGTIYIHFLTPSFSPSLHHYITISSSHYLLFQLSGPGCLRWSQWLHQCRGRLPASPAPLNPPHHEPPGPTTAPNQPQCLDGGGQQQGQDWQTLRWGLHLTTCILLQP